MVCIVFFAFCAVLWCRDWILARIWVLLTIAALEFLRYEKAIKFIIGDTLKDTTSPSNLPEDCKTGDPASEVSDSETGDNPFMGGSVMLMWALTEFLCWFAGRQFWYPHSKKIPCHRIHKRIVKIVEWSSFVCHHSNISFYGSCGILKSW